MQDSVKEDFLRQEIVAKAREIGELYDELAELQGRRTVDVIEALGLIIGTMRGAATDHNVGCIACDAIIAMNSTTEEFHCSPSMMQMTAGGEDLTIDRGRFLVYEDKIQVEWLGEVRTIATGDEAAKIRDDIYANNKSADE